MNYHVELLFSCVGAVCVCFAGVALAVILSGVRHISDTVFLEAAKVSSTLTQEH